MSVGVGVSVGLLVINDLGLISLGMQLIGSCILDWCECFERLWCGVEEKGWGLLERLVRWGWGWIGLAAGLGFGIEIWNF